jgi:hypothetical protein
MSAAANRSARMPNSSLFLAADEVAAAIGFSETTAMTESWFPPLAFWQAIS